MALNPFFLQGSPAEQRLIQDLINEHLKIYGVEVTYIPRKFVRKETILREITSSKFDDNFLLEAYVNSYDGYSGSGDILTKFGMSLKDDLSLIVSKERFQDFISPFLSQMDETEIEISSRPREGDLVYFPLGQRLFEVKFVEHEKPFYQLGKNYVYEVTCELFEYEDEIIDTSIEEIDARVQDQGYITSLNMISFGSTAIASAQLGSGYIREIFLNNDGYSYGKPPTVTIDPPPEGGLTATAIAKIKRVGRSFSVSEILLTNAGTGYTTTPKINISGGGGVGASATCFIEPVSSGKLGVIKFNIDQRGQGYTSSPQVIVNGGLPVGFGTTASAVGIASIGLDGDINTIFVKNSGVGYTGLPSVILGNPSILSGFGNYIFNEIIVGSQSGTGARVKEWDQDTQILKVSFVGVGETTKGFYPGEIVVGSSSSARYSISSVDRMDLYDKYSENDEIEQEADLIIDFSESNLFGNY
jgi:hypothetical protein